MDQFAAILKPLEQADLDRWRTGPTSAGSYRGLTGKGRNGIDALVEDMKNFAFVGGSWPGGSVSTGGRAAHLDRLQGARGEDDEIARDAQISYVGAANFPADALRLRTTDFVDPPRK